jgi:hypothetical protein
MGRGWADLQVTEVTEKEMVLAEVLVSPPTGRPIAFVASWPRSDKQAHADVHAIARAELGIE